MPASLDNLTQLGGPTLTLTLTLQVFVVSLLLLAPARSNACERRARMSVRDSDGTRVRAYSKAASRMDGRLTRIQKRHHPCPPCDVICEWPFAMAMRNWAHGWLSVRGHNV